MSTVTVQVGQCGNQLGTSFFSALAEESNACPDELRRITQEARSLVSNPPRRPALNAPPQAFFRPRSRSDGAAAPACTARAVLVDMEPKVVSSALRAPLAASRCAWGYNERGALSFQSGSGNNWARGYLTYGPHCRELVAELVRREAEAADHLSSFLLLQSMAGGTGAGLGTHVVETLRDDYPSTTVLSHCIWPYESGEVVVQSYNTLLTLSALLDSADGVLLVQNEALAAAATLQMHIPRPCFEDLNSIASRNLVSALLPACWRPTAGAPAAARVSGSLLCETVGRLCSHPQLRLLSLLSVPQMPQRSVDFTTFSWPAQLKRLRQMALTGTSLEEGLRWSLSPDTRLARCVAASLTLRGKGADCADASSLADRALYASWAPAPLSVAYSPQRLSSYEMAATLLANSSCAAWPAERALQRAHAMLSSRAYVHQYAEHGLELDHFEAAFARVGDAVAAYDSL